LNYFLEKRGISEELEKTGRNLGNFWKSEEISEIWKIWAEY
jgi:hypothetical protein